MITHKICFRGEIRKKFDTFCLKCHVCYFEKSCVISTVNTLGDYSNGLSFSAIVFVIIFFDLFIVSVGICFISFVYHFIVGVQLL